jgi:DNA modification methylase
VTDNKHRDVGNNGAMRVPDGLKPKDLMMVPARVAIALQADGWYLRSQLPWLKRNCMPESAGDRPTSAVEYVYLLTKRSRYFWDAEAVKRANNAATIARRDLQNVAAQEGSWRANGGAKTNGPMKAVGDPSGRNFRNSDLFFDSLGLILSESGEPVALDVNPAGFKKAHFATFPPKLVRPLLLAGTSERGACPACGAPWERMVERTTTVFKPSARQEEKRASGVGSTRTALHGTMVAPPTSRTTGWQPGCTCDAGDPIPCVCLDPFGGSGTVALVAGQLGRDSILIDLNPEYVEMANERITGDAPLFAKVETS